MRAFVVAAALAAGMLAPGLALAQYGDMYGQNLPHDTMTPVPRGFSSAQDRYNRDVRKLHDDAVKLQKQDGGHLSDAHKAELQVRLDRLNQDGCAKGLKLAACTAMAAAH